MEYRNLPLSALLDYPRGSRERGERILRELIERGVGELSFVSKGYRGVVFRGLLKGRPVAVKVKRSDTPKEVSLKEFNFLSHLYRLYREETPAPVPYFATEDFIVMEWVSGEILPVAFRKEPRRVVKEALKACYKLDRAGVEHSEIKGEKHLIFTGDRVKVIDFESAKFKERPRNLLQFVGYHLIGKGLCGELGLKEEELREFLSLYKKNPEEGFKSLLSLL